MNFKYLTLITFILYIIFTSSKLPLIDDTNVDAHLLDLIWMAPFFSGGGYSSEAIEFVKALSYNTTVRIYQHGDSFEQSFLSGMNHIDRIILNKMLADQSVDYRNSIVVCHSEPGAWYPPSFNEPQICPPQGSLYTIGRTMFETDRLPLGWKSRLNRMNEIWVPTEFHKNIFAENGVEVDKLFVVPESVDTEYYSPANANSNGPYIFPYEKHKKITTKKFRFLSIFKWEERKGWKILVESYVREFTSDDDTILYILTNAYHSEGDFHRKVDDYIASLNLGRTDIPIISLLPSNLPNAKMPSLYNSVDAFVLPSRGEGWGRPHVEAMSMGLPIIATYWSGPTAFMTHLNSYPLNYTGLTMVKQGAFQGHYWAEPDSKHLQTLMRHIFSNPSEAKSKGLKAREDMLTKFCPFCVSSIVVSHMKRIARKLLSASPERNLYYHPYSTRNAHLEREGIEETYSKLDPKSVEDSKEEIREYYRNNPGKQKDPNMDL